MTESKLLFRPTEAADSLGVSRARLYQLLAAYVQRLRSEQARDGCVHASASAQAGA